MICNRPVLWAAATEERDNSMFDIQKQDSNFSAPRHLRLAVALGALALAPGMVSALDIPGVGGVSIGSGGVGASLLGGRVNANVNTGSGDSGSSVGAGVSVGGVVSANAGVGSSGGNASVSVGGSNGVNAEVGAGSGGVSVGVGAGSGSGGGGGNNPGGSDPGNNIPGDTNPGDTNPGNTNPGSGDNSGTGSGIIITDFDALSQARLMIPTTCAKAGNYDLLIGVPVLTSSNQTIGAIAGAYVEGGVLTRLRVAVDPAYVPPGGCIEIVNLAGSRAGVEGLVLNVSMPTLQGSLH